MVNLFVYGTLIFPEVVFALTGRKFKTENATLQDYYRYSIFDGNIPRAYPAITENLHGEVYGKIIFDVDEESLQILDFFEGKKYKRKAIQVTLDNKPISVFTYVWNEKLKEKLKSDWNPDEFKQNHLRIYVHHKIPDVLKDYKLINF